MKKQHMTRRARVEAVFARAIERSYRIFGERVPPEDRIAMRAASLVERIPAGFIPTGIKPPIPPVRPTPSQLAAIARAQARVSMQYQIRQEGSMSKPSKKRSNRSGTRPGAVTWNERRRQFQKQGAGRVVFSRAMISKRRKV